jgi:tetratricopeptide (TPR) repeat protein
MKKIYLLCAFFFLGPVFADPSPPTNRDPQWLVESRAHVKSGKYEQAIQVLQAANQTTSADWNNLMGFSLRNKQLPDLIGAENYYKAALKIDPRHKGALEYYGMLKLINNDLAGAEELLLRLDRICFFGCEEYSDLKKAIEKHKLQIK